MKSSRKSSPIIKKDAVLSAQKRLSQKNITVAIMVVLLVVLFFFITYTRLKMGVNLLAK
ncbi:MAG: hypothetical protein QM529_03515 [Hydrotalea sp.]|nr:hypothetical protein [Hydrotalea sp.]